MSELIRITTRRAASRVQEREVDFVLSNAVEDRMGDTIAVEGWKLDAYRSNPVILWNHDRKLPAIGHGRNVRTEGPQLVGTVQFATAEQHPFADTVFRLLTGGFLHAGSVGFMPIRWDYSDEGIRFLEQELLEFSVVNIPANPYALAKAAADGVDIAPLARAASAENAKSYSELRQALLDKFPQSVRVSAPNLARFRNRAAALSTKLRVSEYE